MILPLLIFSNLISKVDADWLDIQSRTWNDKKDTWIEVYDLQSSNTAAATLSEPLRSPTEEFENSLKKPSGRRTVHKKIKPTLPFIPLHTAAYAPILTTIRSSKISLSELTSTASEAATEFNSLSSESPTPITELLSITPSMYSTTLSIPPNSSFSTNLTTSHHIPTGLFHASSSKDNDASIGNSSISDDDDEGYFKFLREAPPIALIIVCAIWVGIGGATTVIIILICYNCREEKHPSPPPHISSSNPPTVAYLGRGYERIYW